VADILIIYTSTDQEWAFWIGRELKRLGHEPHIDALELAFGGDIEAWTEEAFFRANHIVCVVSAALLAESYSSLARRVIQRATGDTRQDLILPVFVERCESLAQFSNAVPCNLTDLSEFEASGRIERYLAQIYERADLAKTHSNLQSHGASDSGDAAQVCPPGEGLFNRRTRPEDADFFISRAGADSAIGVSICELLEDSGYRCLIQDRDFGSQNFMSVVNRALRSKARIIALLSDQYQSSDHCEYEWTNAIVGDPQNKNERLIVFRISACDPTGGLAGIRHVDLVPHLNNNSGLRQKVLIHLRSLLANFPARGSRGIHVERLHKIKEWHENGLIHEDVAKRFQTEILGAALDMPVQK
jgi:hypothetical protein